MIDFKGLCKKKWFRYHLNDGSYIYLLAENAEEARSQVLVDGLFSLDDVVKAEEVARPADYASRNVSGRLKWLAELPAKGWRLRNGETDPHKAKEVDVRLGIFRRPFDRDGNDWDVLQVMQGGVTGHESLVLRDQLGQEKAKVNELLSHPYWSACAGGMGWDALRITRQELEPILTAYLKIKEAA